MTDIVERLRDEAVKVAIDRGGNYGLSTRDATSSVIWKAANEIERLRIALIDVTNPIDYLRRYAEKQGAALNGSAHSIANDLHFVQRIAREALESDPAPPSQGEALP